MENCYYIREHTLQIYYQVQNQLNQNNKMNFQDDGKYIGSTHFAIGAFAEVLIAIDGLAVLLDRNDQNILLYKINQYFPNTEESKQISEFMTIAIAFLMISNIFVGRLWFKLVSIMCFAYHNLLCHNLIQFSIALDLGQAILFLSNVIVIWLAISNSIDFNEINCMLRLNKKIESKKQQAYPFQYTILPQQEILISNLNEDKIISDILKVSPQLASKIVKKIRANVLKDTDKLINIGQKQFDSFIKKQTSQLDKTCQNKIKHIEQVTSNMFYSQRRNQNTVINKKNE